MKIIKKDINALIDYEFNNKIHNEKQIDLLMRSIDEYGFNTPVIIDKNDVIIAGHGRVESAKRLGLTELPCIVKDKLTEAQVKKYRLLDNKIAEQADDDIKNIKIELDELQDIELNELYGLDIEIVDEDKEAIEDLVPIEPTNIIVEKWDIFQLWDHRLMCGSSTDVNDLEALLWESKKSDMVFTDPPYLMDFDWGVNKDGSKSFNAKHGGIKNDKMSKEEWEQFLDDINTNILMYNKWAFYITFNRLKINEYYASMDRVWLQHRNLIIWSKGNTTLSNSDYKSMYEPMFYGWCDEHNFYDGNMGKDIWEIARTKKNDLHPTMKPVELVDKAIRDWSKKGDLVLDLFGGSGTTLISAEKNQRKSCLMELDEKYVQVIIKRFYDYTDSSKEIKCLNRELDLTPILND